MRRWLRAPMKTAEDGGDVKIITLYGLEDWLDYSTEVTTCFAVPYVALTNAKKRRWRRYSTLATNTSWSTTCQPPYATAAAI